MLGLQADSRVGGAIPAGGFAVTGLGLLRDPAVPASPANVDMFRPLVIGSGEESPIVVVASAWPCADPTAEVPKDPPNTYTFNRPLPFVYDLLGWRRVTSISFPLEVTLPERAICDLVTTTPG